MNKTDTLARVQGILRDVLDDATLTVGRETTADDVPDWDSLSHVSIVTQVEHEFSIRFALGEIQSLTDVGQMVDLIETKLR